MASSRHATELKHPSSFAHGGLNHTGLQTHTCSFSKRRRAFPASKPTGPFACHSSADAFCRTAVYTGRTCTSEFQVRALHSPYRSANMRIQCACALAPQPAIHACMPMLHRKLCPSFDTFFGCLYGDSLCCTVSHLSFAPRTCPSMSCSWGMYPCVHSRSHDMNLKAVLGSSDIHEDSLNEELVGKEETEDGLQNGKVDDAGGIGVYAGRALTASSFLPPEGLVIVLSCAVGLMTGIGVVLFNVGVDEVHDIVWQGVPSSGASWLRMQPLEKHWVQVLSVPVGGGLVVGILNLLRSSLDEADFYIEQGKRKATVSLKSVLEPVIKTIAALITLATGNSLGPEGPSVEIGATIGKGLGIALKSSRERNLSLIAAGSAAGISSGFDAAVSGCFFAVEAVLRPLSSDSAPALTTAMVLLSSVLAAVVSQAGLGSDPAFRTPAYDFRSPAELPLYLILGILCGLVSIALTKCTSVSTMTFQKLKAITGIPDAFLPPLGSLFVGFMALAYPEVLYWGFENVNILLESRPQQKGPSALLLLQLVGVKIVATSVSRGSGLVGGYYAPSLFIGAALGSAYGKLAGYAVTHADPMYHLDALKVAVPQAYALVGMAATLAGVCQVPLTSVLLLFELTRDYRIIIPLMAAVGVSSSVASALTKKPQQSKKFVVQDKPIQVELSSPSAEKVEMVSKILMRRNSSMQIEGGMRLVENSSCVDELCAVDNSLCMANRDLDEESLISEITVATAMKTCFTTVTPNTTVHEALEMMMTRKEWCVLLVRDGNILEGIVTFSDIQQYAERISDNGYFKLGALTVSAICNSRAHEAAGFPLITAYPDMSLRDARRLMTGRGLRQLPVISREIYFRDKIKVVQGILDRDCILLTCRAEATRRLLGLPLTVISMKSSQEHGQ